MNKFEKVHGLEYWLSKVQLVLFLDLKKRAKVSAKHTRVGVEVCERSKQESFFGVPIHYPVKFSDLPTPGKGKSPGGGYSHEFWIGVCREGS